MRFLLNARIPARDGVELSVDVYLPGGDAPVPAVIHRTPYDNANPDLVRAATYLTEHGYAFVAADVRGRGDSGGVFDPFRGEAEDGYDTVEWVAAQPWCDGQVGMMGGSYGGSTQWWAAAKRPPHLAAMVSTATSGKWVQEPVTAGKLRPSMMIWLHMTAGHTMQPMFADPDGPRLDWAAVLASRPYRDIDVAVGRPSATWKSWLANQDDPEYWAAEDPYRSFAEVDVPVLHITGWFDGSLSGELETYDRMKAESPAGERQRLVIGPWDHGGTRRPQQAYCGLDFGESAVIDIEELHLRWFDRWLKGIDNGIDREPRVRAFLMGANTWLSAPDWPPLQASQLRLFLHSTGLAEQDQADGVLSPEEPAAEPADHYDYDPGDATPSMPDLGRLPGGTAPLDNLEHNYVEDRTDTLTYTTEPLTGPLVICGSPRVQLWAASSAPDTDFAATLSDVWPDGRSVLFGEALVRASFAASAGGTGPGGPMRLDLKLNPTLLEIGAGHRVRLTIASAEFPSYDRNPNTGARIGDDDEIMVARQALYHDAVRPSSVLLPVADAAAPMTELSKT